MTCLVRLGARAGGAGVAPRFGLGQSEGAQGCARAQVRKPLLPLGLGAEGEDRVGAQPDAGLQCDRHR